MHLFVLGTFACVLCVADAHENIRGSWRKALSQSISSESGGSLEPTWNEFGKGATGDLQHQVVSPEQEFRMEPRHGLLFGILILIAAIVFIITTLAWERSYPETVRHVRYIKGSMERVDDDIVRWKMLADAGELDCYTCIALSFGRHKLSKRSVRLIPKLLFVSTIQIGVAFLLIIYMAGKGTGHFYSRDQSFAFRAVAAMLLMYSCWRMYEGMFDECREWILGLLTSPTVKSVSPWYLWPLVFGEIMNVGSASLMIVTLYFIFCQCTRPQDLLINCVAVNFLIDIDNQVVQADDIQEAGEDLREAVNEWSASETESQPEVALARRILPYCTRAIHFLVPMASAYFAIFFLVAGDEKLCHAVRATAAGPYAAWPSCIGIQN